MKKFLTFFICSVVVLLSYDGRDLAIVKTPLLKTNTYSIEKTYKGITYNTYVLENDSYGRRSVSVNKRAYMHALFLGCSLVFSDGVGNSETIPQLFQNMLPGYQAYNYGYSGDGPNKSLYRITHEISTEHIKQKNGICLFFYPVGWHEDRIRLHSHNVQYTKDQPYYGYNKGKLVYKGSLRQVQWFLYKVISVYNALPIPDKWRRVFPKYRTDKDYVLIADILCEIRDVYKKRFNSDDFYVVIHPFSYKYSTKISQLLQEKKLRVIDLNNIYDCQSNIDKYTLAAWDGHSNARMNRLIAFALVGKMRELGY